MLLSQIAAIPIAQFYIEKTPENHGRLITDEEFRRYLAGQRTPQGQATAAAWDTGLRKKFFHWFLEFPEIIENGGFDCILGNPPYKGGQDLSGFYGHPFCGYVKWEYAPAGLSDLVAYFLRRLYSLLRPNGFTAFITTNSIKDGDVRKDGLDQVLASGGTINFAVRGIKWPGRANLVVSLVGLHRGEWGRKCSLDNKEVPVISSYLEDTLDGGEPYPLPENASRIYQGSVVLGDGFLISPEHAKALIEADPKNTEVIFPIINGAELNGRPDQAPDRWVINFFDWPIKKSRSFEQPFAHLESTVFHERIALKNNERYKGAKEKWWLYIWPRPELYGKIRPLKRCFVAAATTKFLNFSAAPVERVFTHALFVFTSDRWDHYSMVQSTIHEVWARKYSGALETRLRYSPSSCFNTFPFPEGLWKDADVVLGTIGERYHEHRHALMLHLWLGLTDIYNLFHNRDLTPAIVAKVSGKPAEADAGYQGILELRKLHRELDEAVLAAYGWTDLNLGHDFHEVETLPENDRVRYTISPEARKELLKRLLALNHQRAEEEKAKAPMKAAKNGKRGRKKKVDDTLGELFDFDYATTPKRVEITPPRIDPALLPDAAWVRPFKDNSNEIMAILAAVLKATRVPTPARQVRLAAILASEPRLLIPSLSAEEATFWKRLVGKEAEPLPGEVATFAPHSDRAWGSAVRHLRSRGMLIEDIASETWAPGMGLESFYTEGWPDGRAQMVLDILNRRNPEKLVSQLPEAIRRWVDEKAA